MINPSTTQPGAKRSGLPVILSILLLSFFHFSGLAITPTSDCSTAATAKFTVGAIGTCTNTAFNFNSAIGLPSIAGTCSTVGTQDGWGWFTAMSNFTRITSSGSNRNIAIYIYSGSCGNLTLIGCVNNATGTGSETILVPTVNGNDYFVRLVRRAGNRGSSTNNVCVSAAAEPPSNDNCTGATELTVNSTCTTISATNVNALQSIAPAVCSGGQASAARDLFFKFVANNTSQTITVDGNGGINPIVQAFSGTCASLTSLGCINATGNGGIENLVLNNLTVGNTYYVRVYTASTLGGFTICVTGNCLVPTAYAVTGGGTYCQGGTAPNVGLSNSQIGFSYQLIIDGNDVGSPVAGTGSAISFGPQTDAGTYTVEATNNGVSSCDAFMTGSVEIIANNAPSFVACPSNVTANTAAGVCTAVVNYMVTAAGQPDPSLSYSFSGATTGVGSGTGSGSTFNAGVTNVSIVANNACSPDANCSFTITVTDAELPAVVCPSNQEFCEVAGGIYTIPLFSSTDNCGIASVSYNITGATNRSGSGNDASGVFATGLSTVEFTATDINGNSNSCSFTVNIKALLPTPGPITGPLDACPLVGLTTPGTYSISAVPGAASYTWTVPVGTTIVSGQGTTSLQVTFDNSFALTNSRFRVVAEAPSACTSLPSILEVLKNIPGIPVAINGPTNVCPFIGLPTNATYTIDPVPFATSYLWTVPTGATIVSGQGTTSVDVNFASFTSGAIRVTALSNCGNRAPRSLTLTRLIPAAPAAITGPTNVCQFLGNNLEATYSIAAVPNATSYLWTVPAGVTLVSGQGTTSVNVTFAANYTNGIFRVRSVSNCSSSSDRTLSVITTTYAAPGAISGPTDACSFITNGTIATYTIRKVNNAPAYLWTVPAGATIVSHPGGAGVNDTIIEVLYDNSLVTNSVLSVQATGCGTTAASSITITRIAATTAVPSLISGPRSVCGFMVSATQPNGLPATYTIRKVNGAVAYSWIAPANATIASHPGGFGANDTIVEVIYNSNFTNGVLNVAASSGCGFGGNRSLSVTRFTPSAAGAIDVVLLAGCPSRQYSYTLPSLPNNATSIVWTVPSGAVIVSGQGTTSIIVQYQDGIIDGNIAATPTSNCGQSSTRVLEVKLPACPAPRMAITSATGIELKDNLDITISPNPTTTSFTITAPGLSKEKVVVNIRDIQGRLLQSFSIQPQVNVKFGNELKPGSYFIEVIQGATKTTQRVIKL